MARQIQEVEFVPGDESAVVSWMDRLAAAGDGWINLLPGVPVEEVEEPVPGVFSALFGTAQAPVTMGTWLPADPERRGREAVTLGILHPRGRAAVRQLAAAGVALPQGWRVRQDHPRRGLIVHPDGSSGNRQVLEWALTAGTTLAAVSLTGRWLARIYLPRSSAAAPRSTTS